MGKNILVVDDDPHIREVICFALENAGMTTKEVKNGKEALSQFIKHPPELVILDINMPEMDGFQFCKEIRKQSEVPILFLSSRDDEIDRVVGFEIGGDDYVSKPFSPRELVARVHAILKRAKGKPAPTDNSSKILFFGRVSLNTEKHQVFWDETPVDLTAREFDILKAFLLYPESVFDRNRIIEHAYGNSSFVSDRTIDSHIRHIRNKFSLAGGKGVIETVFGVGYVLGSCKQ